MNSTFYRRSVAIIIMMVLVLPSLYPAAVFAYNHASYAQPSGQPPWAWIFGPFTFSPQDNATTTTTDSQVSSSSSAATISTDTVSTDTVATTVSSETSTTTEATTSTEAITSSNDTGNNQPTAQPTFTTTQTVVSETTTTNQTSTTTTEQTSTTTDQISIQTSTTTTQENSTTTQPPTTTTVNQPTTNANEFLVVFEVNPSGAGSTNPTDSSSYASGATISISATANSGYAFSSWSVSDSTSIVVADSTLASTTATINGVGTITANFNPTTVQPADTQTSITCNPDSVNVGDNATCTATVSGGPSVSGQTVSWGSTGSGMFDSIECAVDNSGSCSVTYSPTAAGDGGHTITANYIGDASHNPSTGNFTLTVTGSLTITTATTSSVTNSGNAKIWTDQADYSPGDTPTIYGSGFLSNASVTVTVLRPEGTQNSWGTTSDSTGTFTTTYATDGLVSGTFTVTVTDGANTATTTFTDTSKNFDYTGPTPNPLPASSGGSGSGSYGVIPTTACTQDADLTAVFSAKFVSGPQSNGFNFVFTPSSYTWPQGTTNTETVDFTVTVDSGVPSGTYVWKLVADATSPNAQACGESNGAQLTLTVTGLASPTLATSVKDSNGVTVTSPLALGSSVHDTATMTGGSTTITGTVTYSFYSSGDCSGTSTTQDVTIVTNTIPDSSATGALGAGSYSYKAHYGGDTNNNPSTSDCEPFSVNMATPGITTEVSPSTTLMLGQTASDTATVTGVDSIPVTGSVTYSFYLTGDCSGVASSTETVSVGSSSSSTAALAVGSYSYKATYGGDSNYGTAPSDCEPFTVSQADTTISTTITPTPPLNLGDSASDSASWLEGTEVVRI